MMYQIRELKLDEIRAIYNSRMTRDFPADELKPLKMIEDAIARNEYISYGILEEDEILGYAYLAYARVPQGRRYLFDYLGVREDLRGTGIGSILLHQLPEILPEPECILGEVENPEYAQTDKERAMQERRIAFYERNDIADTGVTCRLYNVEYRVMEQPVGGRIHTSEEAHTLYTELYRAILPADKFKTMLQIHDLTDGGRAVQAGRQTGEEGHVLS